MNKYLYEDDIITRADYKVTPSGRKVKGRVVFVDGSDTVDAQQKELEARRRENEANKTQPNVNAGNEGIVQTKGLPGVKLKKRRSEGSRQSAARHDNAEIKESSDMSDEDEAQRERYIKGMKKNIEKFKQRYGAKANDVMYATATKMAMQEEDVDSTTNQGVFMENQEKEPLLTFSQFVEKINEQLLEYDSNAGRYVHKGSYGTSYQGDEDGKKPEAPAVKRGRGRPAGSKSGANVKGQDGGSPHAGAREHSLNLPNRR